jgi:uncharacterized protein YbjT (DUF2867 family)
VDIAAVAHHLLTHPAPSGMGCPVTGPEALTPREQVAVLADVLGKPIAVHEQTPKEARDQIVQYGTDPELAQAIVDSMGSPLNGHGQTPLPTVEDLTGLPPRTFQAWAIANQAAFTHPAPAWT